MNWGLDMDKLLLIGIVAVLIIGPERLPKAAEALRRFARQAAAYLRDTKDKMKDELGEDIDDVDWRKLDPRQYDPRRIIRDALFEEPAFDSAPATTSNPFTTDPVAAPERAPMTRQAFSRMSPPPFDVEAT